MVMIVWERGVMYDLEDNSKKMRFVVFFKDILMKNKEKVGGKNFVCFLLF